MIWIPTLGFLTMVTAGPAATKDVNAQVYKDQFCTDPRTMRKHAAYTEWADAYSCSRHRCQPGGRNLAIYTVGCKRVEAPESAIECEEVVEDTNMQFPFCCMRLRCLVVVRGEVWTRVLGQPWEVLPAAPWSHMYKMKKPPPADTAFQPKANEQGPVYELSDPTSETEHEKVPRSGRKQTPSDSTDCNEVMPRALPASAPDIVIALSTNNEKEFNAKNQDVSREEEKVHHEPDPQDLEETAVVTEKPPEHDASDEKFFGARFGLKEKQPNKVSPQQFGWTDIPPSQWNDHEHDHEHEHEHEHEGIENRGNNVMELRYTQEPRSPGFSPVEPVERAEEKAPKSNNLQALVDAIGTRMRDIENVVQRMSEKVHHSKTTQEASIEKNRIPAEVNFVKHHKPEVKETKPKTEVELEHSSDDERYKQRFSIRGRNNKILHSSSPETTSEQPLFIEDNTNYFSDASNAVRRAQLQPKEPHTMYMAPVENHHKAPPQINLVPDTSAPEEVERKKKKHSHKKKKNKSHVHKKHHNVDKRKHFNKLSSVEIDKNAVSMEDSSIILSN